MRKLIRTGPVSLNESTLETNIVGEIAALFKQPNGLSYPLRLRWLFGIPTDLGSVISRKVKIYRLTPIEENRRGGWDSKVEIPLGNGSTRAFFIQFKAGKHSEGNNIPKSIFNINERNPNKHAEFCFNNNSGNNQHQTLKTLHDELIKQGLPAKSVMYGFPRVTTLKTFESLEDDLILHTTFLSIDEMDAKAKGKGIDLYDGKEHHFRTCYFDESRREISSEPFELGSSESTSGVLYEILLTTFVDWKKQRVRVYPEELMNEEFFLVVANYLKINPFSLYKFDRLRFREVYESETRDYFQRLEDKSINDYRKMFGGSEQNRNGLEWKRELFDKIAEFVNESPDDYVKIQEQIPSNYSFILPNEKAVEINVEQGSSYNLLTF